MSATGAPISLGDTFEQARRAAQLRRRRRDPRGPGNRRRVDPPDRSGTRADDVVGCDDPGGRPRSEARARCSRAAGSSRSNARGVFGVIVLDAAPADRLRDRSQPRPLAAYPLAPELRLADRLGHADCAVRRDRPDAARFPPAGREGAGAGGRDAWSFETHRPLRRRLRTHRPLSSGYPGFAVRYSGPRLAPPEGE